MAQLKLRRIHPKSDENVDCSNTVGHPLNLNNFGDQDSVELVGEEVDDIKDFEQAKGGGVNLKEGMSKEEESS